MEVKITVRKYKVNIRHTNDGSYVEVGSKTTLSEHTKTKSLYAGLDPNQQKRDFINQVAREVRNLNVTEENKVKRTKANTLVQWIITKVV